MICPIVVPDDHITPGYNIIYLRKPKKGNSTMPAFIRLGRQTTATSVHNTGYGADGDEKTGFDNSTAGDFFYGTKNRHYMKNAEMNLILNSVKFKIL